MTIATKDDWEKPRSKSQHLTAEEIRRIKVAFNQGRLPREIARELQCSSRVVAKYYADFRGKPNKREKPLYRELMHQPKPIPAGASSRFYKSNFEL